MSEKLEFDLGVRNNQVSKALEDSTKKAKFLETAMASAVGFFSANVVQAGLAKIKGVFSQAIGEARTFSKSVAEINSILPKNAKLTEESTASLKELAKQYGSDAQSQAKAFYNIVSAGVQGTSNQLDVLKQSNEAATAGLVNIDTATTVLVSSVNAYAASGLTAKEASDSLFQAVKDGQTTFGELAGALGRVAPLASSAGVSFQDLNGTIAFLTSAGIKTDQAVTGLRGALTAIIKPTEEAKKEARKLGLELSVDGVAAAGGFAEFLEKVKVASGGSAASISQLFGSVEATNAILAITGGSFERFTSQIDNNRRSLGATKDAAGEVKQSLDFELSQTEAEAKSLALTIGNLMVPAIQDFAAGLRLIGRLFKENTDQYSVQREKLAELADEYNNVTRRIDEAKEGPKFKVNYGDAIKGLQTIEQLEARRNAILKERQDLRAFINAPGGETASTTGASNGEAELAAAREQAARLIALKQEQNAELLNLDNQLTLERANAVKEQANLGLEDANLKQQAELERMTEFERQKTELEFQLKDQQAQAIEDANERNFNIQKTAKEKELALTKQANAAIVKQEGLRIEQEKRVAQERIALQQATASTLTGIVGTAANLATLLTKEGSKELFLIQKTAALAQAIVAMNTGIALANVVPPPGNIAAAAAAKAQGAIAISGIVATTLKGFAEGGIIGGDSSGASAGPDNTTFQGRKGEMVLTADDQKLLLDGIRGGSFGGGDIRIEIDGVEIFKVVRNQVKKGYKL